LLPSSIVVPTPPSWVSWMSPSFSSSDQLGFDNMSGTKSLPWLESILLLSSLSMMIKSSTVSHWS
jgi:hypothetical protein